MISGFYTVGGLDRAFLMLTPLFTPPAITAAPAPSRVLYRPGEYAPDLLTGISFTLCSRFMDGSNPALAFTAPADDPAAPSAYYASLPSIAPTPFPAPLNGELPIV